MILLIPPGQGPAKAAGAAVTVRGCEGVATYDRHP